MDSRISIHICTKDRHSETALLLQSLRTQTYQAFDIIILDDASGSPVNSCHFIMALINRLKLEGHKVKLLRNNISYGVCAARNTCIENDHYNNEFTCRLDDDCIPQPDYLKRLLDVIEHGYDIATGVIPLLATPELIREPSTGNCLICEHKIDKEGNLISNKDELAYCYRKIGKDIIIETGKTPEHKLNYDSEAIILDCHQFRTNALYKSIIHEKVKYPTNLTKVGFREEGFFSLKALSEGYKIGVDLHAVAYHLQTPSGGCRTPDYAECVQIDHETFLKWIKTNKAKLEMLQ